MLSKSIWFQVAAPLGHRAAQEVVERLVAEGPHPLGLALHRRDLLDDVVGEAPLGGEDRVDRVVPAVLVGAQLDVLRDGLIRSGASGVRSRASVAIRLGSLLPCGSGTGWFGLVRVSLACRGRCGSRSARRHRRWSSRARPGAEQALEQLGLGRAQVGQLGGQVLHRAVVLAESRPSAGSTSAMKPCSFRTSARASVRSARVAPSTRPA